MTKIKRLTTLALLTFIFQTSFGQSNLFGTWIASCPLEKTDAASAKFCGLCPTVQKDKSSMDINDFEMTVDKNEIKLKIDGKTTPLKYSWDEDLQSIGFQYKDTKYSFKVLSGGQSNFRVLKNPDGQIVMLTKK